MATLLQPLEDEDEKARLETMASLGPASMRGRPSRNVQGTGGAAGGGGFVGLDKYAAANQGATAELGNKVVGAVNDAGTAARGALTSASDAFGRQSAAGRVDYDPNLIQRLNTNATELAGDAKGSADFARQRDAAYTGPRALEETAEYADVQSKYGDADRIRELAGTDGGLGELSKRGVTGTRTAGGAALDTQLLLGDESLRGKLDTARGSLGTLDAERDTARGAATEQAKAGEATSTKTREQTRGELVKAQAGFVSALDASERQKELEAYYRGLEAQNAVLGLKYGEKNLPTTGTQGVYRTYDSAGRPLQDTRGAQAGNVPEFIDYTGGEQMLPQFDANLASYTAAQRASALQKTQALADLGLTPEQMNAFIDLNPVGELARSGAIGTTNVNPYASVEDYWSRLGDLNRFVKFQDPNAAVTRENAASRDDYARSAALDKLSGTALAQNVLDEGQIDQAGTAPLDIVDLDVRGLAQAKQDAIAALARRTAATVQGNARSGSESLLKRYGQAIVDPSSLWGGPLAPLIAAAKVA